MMIDRRSLLAAAIVAPFAKFLPKTKSRIFYATKPLIIHTTGYETTLNLEQQFTVDAENFMIHESIAGDD